MRYDKHEAMVRICARIAEGESLRRVCDGKNGLPAWRTILEWVAADPALAQQYALACDARADAMAEQILDIADAASGTPEQVQAARLAVDARKWILARMAPRRYGDRVSAEVSGPGGGPVRLALADDLTDEQLAAIAAGVTLSS